MAIVTKQVIYLGTYADADTDEASLLLDNPSVYLNSFGSPAASLEDDIIEMTFDDADNNSSIEVDNTVGEQISYDLGAGPVTTLIDSLAVADVTVTYTDGTSSSFSNVVLFQAATGAMFLGNSNFAGTDITGASKIESINVTALDGLLYVALWQNALQDFVCFAAGTMVATPQGPRAVEELQIGDAVMTLDRQAQPIRWRGARTVTGRAQRAPVRIRRNALGPNVPTQDLLVSQQHRMLVRSPVAERMFGTPEVLVAAKRLLGLKGVQLCPRPSVTYHHLLFDRHEVILANGAPTESLLPGPEALRTFGAAALLEVAPIACACGSTHASTVPARFVPRGRQQRRLCARLAQNKRQVLEECSLAAS